MIIFAANSLPLPRLPRGEQTPMGVENFVRIGEEVVFGATGHEHRRSTAVGKRRTANPTVYWLSTSHTRIYVHTV